MDVWKFVIQLAFPDEGTLPLATDEIQKRRLTCSLTVCVTTHLVGMVGPQGLCPLCLRWALLSTC